jgi:hypothetical protein
MLTYLPLSLAISLIFGLPALRNIQPYVPPVGALGDYLSFIWAELFVATAAIITIWSCWHAPHRTSHATLRAFGTKRTRSLYEGMLSGLR